MLGWENINNKKHKSGLGKIIKKAGGVVGTSWGSILLNKLWGATEDLREQYIAEQAVGNH